MSIYGARCSLRGCAGQGNVLDWSWGYFGASKPRWADINEHLLHSPENQFSDLLFNEKLWEGEEAFLSSIAHPSGFLK